MLSAIYLRLDGNVPPPPQDECSFLDYVKLLMISQAIQGMKVTRNAKKWPPNCQKMKCLFLDYVQLLMIGQAIQVMKVTQNAKNWPPNQQKMKCLFSDYVQLLMTGQAIQGQKSPKMQKKWLPNCQKMKCSFSDYVMLIFALCSTADDQPKNLCDRSCTKYQKMAKIFMAKLT